MYKILIIEDEEITAFALEELLISLNYIVTDCVNNATDALKSVKSNVPDLIISDIMIKGNISGCEVSAKIYQKYNIPIIFLTAYFDDEILEYAKQSNPLAYIVKPYKEEEIKATLKLAFYKEDTINTNIIEDEIIKIDKYFFDIKKQQLFLDDSIIRLGGKSLKLLTILAKQKNQCVSYDNILVNLYDEIDGQSLDKLRHLIRRLKEKLKINSIKSEKQVGYILKI